MTQYMARQSFVDPSDGQPIVAGRTLVSHEADAYRRFPERFCRWSGDGLARSDGIVRVRLPRPPGRRKSSRPIERPAWLLETTTEPWRL